MKLATTTAALTFLLGVGGRAPVSWAAGKGAVESEGAVDSVVVFVDRARITRLATAVCEKGSAKVTFMRLPATLDPRTLRGEVQEAADVLGLVTDVVNEQQAVDPRARELETQREKIETDIRINEARRNVITAELKELDAFAGVFGATVGEEMRNPRPNTAAWGKTMESFRARRGTRDEEQRKLYVALRGLRLQADRIGRELAHLGGAEARAYRTASVIVDCRKLSRVTAVLSYVVPGATWRPEYDLDFTPPGGGERGATGRLA